jgi:hypothetical protein
LLRIFHLAEIFLASFGSLSEFLLHLRELVEFLKLLVDYSSSAARLDEFIV